MVVPLAKKMANFQHPSTSPAVPDFSEWEDQAGVDDAIPTVWFPNIEFAGRIGLADKADLTLRLNTTMNLGIGGKFQVVGDRESQVAMALGVELGTFALVLGNVQVPVYFSVHPQENFAWYLTPRFVYQFSSYTGAENGLGYMGGNTGLLFGNRHKFGLDLGYYRATILSNGGGSIGVIQFGLGGRFALGRN